MLNKHILHSQPTNRIILPAPVQHPAAPAAPDAPAAPAAAAAAGLMCSVNIIGTTTRIILQALAQHPAAAAAPAAPAAAAPDQCGHTPTCRRGSHI